MSRSISLAPGTDTMIRKDTIFPKRMTTKLDEISMLSSATDAEVDSRDASASKPIHLNSDPLESSFVPKNNTEFPFPPRKKSRLTLSAFRKPEHTVRLTNSDPARRLETEYNFYAAGCGVLGHGAFSTVRLAERRRDGVKVAVKSIAKHDALRSRRLRLSTQQQRHYLEEWEILRRMQDHSNVITLLDLFETDEEIQLVTEYCSGGELFDAIQRKKSYYRSAPMTATKTHTATAISCRRWQYSETQASCITSDVLLALADLHAQDIVHRDVKPENILIAENRSTSNCKEDCDIHVKLCDFGVARLLIRETDVSCEDSDGDQSPLTPGRSRQYSAIGSDYYVAPEVVFGGGYYDTAVDIYSLGVTLYVLLCGFPPVFADAAEENSEVVFPDSYWKNISDDAKQLVRKMLTRDPEARISASQALQDPWITRNSCPDRKQRQRDQQQRANKHFLSGEGSTPNSNEQRQIANLDLVRSQLYRSIRQASKKDGTSTKRKRGLPSPLNSKKRPSSSKLVRTERRASTPALIALADLYRGVTTVSPTAKVIAAGVGVCADANLKKDLGRCFAAAATAGGDTRMEIKKKREERKSTFTAAIVGVNYVQ